VLQIKTDTSHVTVISATWFSLWLLLYFLPFRKYVVTLVEWFKTKLQCEQWLKFYQ